MITARVVVDLLNRDNDLSAMFSSQHAISRDTASLGLHKYIDRYRTVRLLINERSQKQYTNHVIGKGPP